MIYTAETKSLLIGCTMYNEMLCINIWQHYKELEIVDFAFVYLQPKLLHHDQQIMNLILGFSDPSIILEAECKSRLKHGHAEIKIYLWVFNLITHKWVHAANEGDIAIEHKRIDFRNPSTHVLICLQCFKSRNYIENYVENMDIIISMWWIEISTHVWYNIYQCGKSL